MLRGSNQEPGGSTWPIHTLSSSLMYRPVDQLTVVSNPNKHRTTQQTNVPTSSRRHCWWIMVKKCYSHWQNIKCNWNNCFSHTCFSYVSNLNIDISSIYCIWSRLVRNRPNLKRKSCIPFNSLFGNSSSIMD